MYKCYYKCLSKGCKYDHTIIEPTLSTVLTHSIFFLDDRNKENFERSIKYFKVLYDNQL